MDHFNLHYCISHADPNGYPLGMSEFRSQTSELLERVQSAREDDISENPYADRTKHVVGCLPTGALGKGIINGWKCIPPFYFWAIGLAIHHSFLRVKKERNMAWNAGSGLCIYPWPSGNGVKSVSPLVGMNTEAFLSLSSTFCCCNPFFLLLAFIDSIFFCRLPFIPFIAQSDNGIKL
ncbi:hypothetical protein BX666DRAFT_1283450 [Dichotomocladium elegans]|nr:hypothetical protein BX666DRAFT_1283450 [Dichotomocladium elegans]